MKKYFVLIVTVTLIVTLGACTNQENPVTCDEGYERINDECVLEEEPITCETGYVLNETTNECELEPVVCYNGEVLNDETNECEEVLVCEDGYEVIDEECVKIVPEIDFNDIYPEYNSYYQLFVRSFADSDNEAEWN